MMHALLRHQYNMGQQEKEMKDNRFKRPFHLILIEFVRYEILENSKFQYRLSRASIQHCWYKIMVQT
jgi:hypothetical protein